MSNRSGVRRAAAVAAAALGLALSGCMLYDADIRVATNGEVTVHERFALDPEWVAEAGDTFQAAGRVMTNMANEGKKRGGTVTRFGNDSVTVDFDYPTLASFARAWPDSTDEGKQWDRALYRQRGSPSGPLNEIILWRQGPPERGKRNANQRLPTLTFWVTLPVFATHTNAHVTRGRSYGWQFTEKMTKPDSVWLVWPVTSAP